ncbi:hypothetical protein [uncultured Clostridium sp.]|uniref:hypothetical protein n=1 Tax=uncultured Clostridium sp. TaxID=59620 RepID=UPI00262FC72B|nr:hypothetical protein [uncultured Clostridium sp.]
MNYTKYMETHMQKAYADIIYPAIYGKKYEEPVQTTMFDDEQDDLSSDEQTIDSSNAEARTRGQFKQGNEYRFKSKQQSKGQLSLDDIDDVEEEGNDE